MCAFYYQLPDWVQIYFIKIVDKKYKCNVCAENVLTDEKCLDLLKHITSNHKEIYELHKENSDASIGFQIEFLQLNMLKEEEKQGEITMDSIQETTLEDVSKCISPRDENGVDMHYVLLPRKKKVRRTTDGAVDCTRKRSWVWKYFDKLSNIIYRCNLCNVVLSIKGCNTNNMNRHVRTRHPTVYQAEVERKKDASDIDISSDTVKKESLVILEDSIKDLDDSSESKQRRSWVWAYFKRMSSTLAMCRLCNRTICHGGNATGNMNRHLKMLHHKTGESEDTTWVWKVFELTEHDFYSCKICQFKCMKFDDVEKNIACILEHLKSEHGVVSGDQIITGPEYDLDDNS